MEKKRDECWECYELPGFSTLVKAADHVHASFHNPRNTKENCANIYCTPK